MMLLENAYEQFVIPAVRILFLILVITAFVYLFYYIITKILKLKNIPSRNELLSEKEQLLSENQSLSKQLINLQNEIAQLKNMQVKNNTHTTQLLNIGNLKIKSDKISFIVPQSYEQEQGGNSRIKIIHYADYQQCDSVYCTFDELLEKLSGNFMLINKNQLINLQEIHKVQGLEVYLKGIKGPFYISAQKKEEFDLRINRL